MILRMRNAPGQEEVRIHLEVSGQSLNPSLGGQDQAPPPDEKSPGASPAMDGVNRYKALLLVCTTQPLRTRSCPFCGTCLKKGGGVRAGIARASPPSKEEPCARSEDS